jgi:hypothetical protein
MEEGLNKRECWLVNAREQEEFERATEGMRMRVWKREISECVYDNERTWMKEWVECVALKVA